jgi:uncharacterized protein YqhQ
MMVGPHAIAVAVRKEDGTIETAVEPFTMPGAWSKDIPFLRGLVSFGGMLQLSRVAAKLENQLNGGKRKWQSILPQLAPGVGATVADALTRQLAQQAGGRLVVPIEVAGGVALPFLAFGVSGQMPGVRELWRYHGAEHKAVNAAESGLKLTAENAATMSRVHPRCGTVMAFWGMVGGMLSRSYVNRLSSPRRKTIAGVLAAPVIIATAYEAVRLGAAVKDHPVGKAVFGPAWQTQRFTTAEPGPQELDVACAALQAVIDFEEAHAA